MHPCVCATLSHCFLHKTCCCTWKFSAGFCDRSGFLENYVPAFPWSCPNKAATDSESRSAFHPKPRGQAKWLVTPVCSHISWSVLHWMRPRLNKKAELMFLSKDKGRGWSRALSFPVVSSSLAVNLGCLSDPKLSLPVQENRCFPLPMIEPGSLSKTHR